MSETDVKVLLAFLALAIVYGGVVVTGLLGRRAERRAIRRRYEKEATIGRQAQPDPSMNSATNKAKISLRENFSRL